MDPLAATVVIVLGKYALDKAPEIIPALGAEVSRALGRLFKFVTEHVASKGTREATITEEFASDPETFAKPFAKILEAEILRDPSFAESIRAMIDEYNKAVLTSGLDPSYQVSVGGDLTSVGSVFGSGSVQAGGDIVGGSKNRYLG